MTAEGRTPDESQPPGLLRSLRTFAATLVEVARTRLELLAAEFEDERLRILQLVLWLGVALFFMAMAVIMLTVFVLILFWDSHRVLAAFLLAAAYFAVAVVAAVRVRNQARVKSRLFAASLAELAKDREELTPR